MFFRSRIAPSLLALSVSLALSSGAAFASNKQVEKVPQDTLFYFGTGKPVAVEDFFSMLPSAFDAATLQDLLPEGSESEGSEEILEKVNDFFKDPTALTEEWGLGDELQFSAYTVGIMPVFRIKADGKQFDAAFEKAVADTEKKFEIVTHNGVDIRISPLEDGSDKASAAESGPTAEEIASEKAELEEKLSTVEEENKLATEALEKANSSLDAAKSSNDASGIANAANELAEAAARISDGSTEQSELEAQLAKLNNLADDAKKKLAAGGKAGPGVITAAVDGDLIFAVASNAYDPDVLDQLLGLVEPEDSLEDSDKLKKIRSEWGYGDEMAMFFDFKLIADAVTGGETLAAQQLLKLAASEEEMQEGLAAMSAEPCRSEIRQLAEQMPMMVSGNRRFEVTDETVDYESHFAMILESEPLKNTLKLLRGAVPVSQSGSEAMFSMGLGLNVDTTPQLSAQVTDLVGGISYECELFDGLNKLAQTDISALSMGAMMFSGMARGVKGISFNLYDGDIDTDAPMPVKGIDSAIAIAAEDPAMLVQTLRMLPQMDMLSGLPMDGTPISLNELIPVPVPEDAEFFAAVKDKSIVIYSGEQAEDFANRLGGNGEEGFIFSSINTRKFIEKVSAIVGKLPESMREEKELDSFAGFMEAYPAGNISYKIDFTDKGIELESESLIDRAAK